MLNLKQNSLQIETPSFLINYSIRNLTDPSHMAKLMNNAIKFPLSLVFDSSTIGYFKVNLNKKIIKF